MAVFQSMTDTIGKTPLVRLNCFAANRNTIYAKMESFNPASCVKERIALAMITEGEKQGLIDRNTVIIEPTSGNTGIGLASVAAARGYRLILTMPETMSIERRKILSLLGAEIVLTEGARGMKGAVEKALEIKNSIKGAFMPNQFENPANPEIHRKTTAVEIWEDLNGKIDFFVAGVGTGGTITGVGEYMKQKNPEIRIIAVEPESSAVLSGKSPGTHRIQGIGAGFVPAVLNRNIIDEIVTVSDSDAFESARQLASAEGILAGISSGAAYFAAAKIAQRAGVFEKVITVMFPDSLERYLSMI